MKDYTLSTGTAVAEHLDKWYRFCQVTKQPFTNVGTDSYRQVALTNGTSISVATTGVVTGVGTTFIGQILAGDVLVSASGQRFSILATATSDTTAQTVYGPIAAVVASTGWTLLRSFVQGATADVMRRTIDLLTIKAHGIPIYSEFPAGFYNAYVPFHYGGPNVQTPEDLGALMINFCLYPGTYQPSGHINVSRAREFYLEYTSDPAVINSTSDGVLVVLASALNFLLISDGSAVLRYST